MSSKAQPHEAMWHLSKCAILKILKNRYYNFEFLLFYTIHKRGWEFRAQNEFAFNLKSQKLNSSKSTTMNYQISL